MIEAGITDARDQGGGPVTILAVIEETAEMLGATLLAHALLRHLARDAPARHVLVIEANTASIPDAVAPDAKDARMPRYPGQALPRPEPLPGDMD